MSEERILRLTFDEFETLGGFLEQPCKLTIVRKMASMKWSDLELAPRPEKEIRKEWEDVYQEANMFNDKLTEGWYSALGWAFPYLSEEKTEEPGADAQELAEERGRTDD